MPAGNDDKYVRVYYTILSDERFDSVRDDDSCLATWLRLLLIADAMWPAPADLPRRVGKGALRTLVTAGLVEFVTGERFRIHGLDQERERRKAEQRTGGHVRAMTGARGLDGRYLPAGSPPLESTAGPPPLATTDGHHKNQLSLDEQRRAEPSVAAPAREGNEEPHPLMEAIRDIEVRTRRSWVFGEGSKLWDTLSADVRDFGWPAVHAAMEQEKAPFPDAAQLIFGASRRLHPISGPEKQAEPDPEWVAKQLAERRARRKNGGT